MKALRENRLSNSKQEDTRKSPSLGERLKELAERLGEFLDDLGRPTPEPTPVPVRPQGPRPRRR
jgi:hypothetical protein